MMTPQQVKKLQWLTAHIPARNHIDGAVSFCVEVLAGSGRVLLCATNAYSDLRWFEKHQSCYVTVGPRGGIVRHSGDLSI